MRSISELFEFISYCDKETQITKLMEYYESLYKENGIKSIR